MRAAWWWIDRWRKSTAYTDLTLAEQGAYRNLLDELWLRGGFLPDDDRILGKIAGSEKEWRKVRRNVLAHFVLTASGWRNDTHDEVFAQSLRRAHKQKTYRERLKLVSGNRVGNATGNGASNNPGSPSPSPSLKRDLANPKDQSRTGVKNTPVAQPKKPADPRVMEFLDWFQLEYKRRRHGADYLVKWPRDAPLVKQMLGATSLDRLKLLAQAMLSDKCTEDFIVNTDRGIGILSVKFNWLSDRVAEWQNGLKSQTS